MSQPQNYAGSIQPDFSTDDFIFSNDRANQVRQAIKEEIQLPMAIPTQQSERPSNNNGTPDSDSQIGMFTVHTGRQWLERASKRPIPKMLLGELWYESELCILFSDTNTGKSIGAVQVGDGVSRGVKTLGLAMEAKAQPVLYFDFELSDKQFEARYSKDYSEHYPFASNFIRAEINPESVIPDDFRTFEDYLSHSLEQAIIQTGTRVLIIDNITYLRTDNERAKDALPLMKQLKALKSKYGLSILCLAHTPKRDLSKPLTRNDLMGSKMLMSFCDSSFAIGESSRDNSFRYIKQIKERNTPKVYGDDNVIVCQITKPFNFLGFEFVEFGRESDHLRQLTEKDSEQRNEAIQQLKKEGLSNVEIGRRLGISEGAVRKQLKKLVDQPVNS